MNYLPGSLPVAAKLGSHWSLDFITYFFSPLLTKVGTNTIFKFLILVGQKNGLNLTSFKKIREERKNR